MARNKLVGNVTALMFKRVFDWRLRTERAVRPQRDRQRDRRRGVRIELRPLGSDHHGDGRQTSNVSCRI